MPKQFPWDRTTIQQKIIQCKNELARAAVAKRQSVQNVADEINNQAIIDIFYAGVSEYHNANTQSNITPDIIRELWNNYCKLLPEARRLRSVVISHPFRAPTDYLDALKKSLLLRIPTFLLNERISISDNKMRLRYFQNIKIRHPTSNNAIIITSEAAGSGEESFVDYWIKKQKSNPEKNELTIFDFYNGTQSTYNRHTKGKCCFEFIAFFEENIKDLLKDEQVKLALSASRLSASFLIPLLYEQQCGFLTDYYTDKTNNIFYKRYANALSKLDVGALIADNDSIEDALSKFCKNARYNASLISGPAITVDDRTRQERVATNEMNYRNETTFEKRKNIIDTYQGDYNADVSAQEILADDYSIQFNSIENQIKSPHITALLQAAKDNTGTNGFAMDSEEIFIDSFFRNNLAYLRQLNREDSGDELFQYQLLRLWDAYVKSEACLVPQEKRDSVKAKITFDNKQLVHLLKQEEAKDKEFLEQLNLIRTKTPNSYGPEEKELVKKLQAVAKLWAYPDSLMEVEEAKAQCTEFYALYAENKATRLRIAIDWMTTHPELVKKIIDVKLTKTPEPENRAQILRRFIPVFLSKETELGMVSRLFSKGGLQLQNILTSAPVRELFDEIPRSIELCEDLEEALVLQIKKILKAVVKEFKMLFPDPTIFDKFTHQFSSDHPAGKNDFYKRNALIAQLICISLANIYEGVVDRKFRNSIAGQYTAVLTQRAAHFFISLSEPIASESIANAEDFYTELDKDIDASCDPNNFEKKRFNIAESQNFSSILLEACVNCVNILDILVYKEMTSSISKLEEKIPNQLYLATLEKLNTFDNFSSMLRGAASNGNYTEQAELIEFLKNLYKKQSLYLLLKDSASYFNTQRIQDYLKEVINGIVKNYGGEPTSKKDMLDILDLHFPLHIKLKLISSIAIGKKLQPSPAIDIGRRNSWSAQKIYKQLSCLADVTESNITEKFTELLIRRGDIDAHVQNIEHEIKWYSLIQKDEFLCDFLLKNGLPKIAVLTSLTTKELWKKIQFAQNLLHNHEGDWRAAIGKRNISDDLFFGQVEKWLDFSQETSAPMSFKWITCLPETAIPSTENEFVEFIQSIFKLPQINTLFAKLITVEKQTEFVTALAKTLMSYQPDIQPETEKNILARVQNMFIPIYLSSPSVSWQEYSDTDTDDKAFVNPFIRLIKKLGASTNIEEYLWQSIEKMLKTIIPNRGKALINFDKIIQKLVKLHNQYLREQATFEGQIAAVLVERAVDFLQKQNNLSNETITASDFFTELDNLIKDLGPLKRNREFGLDFERRSPSALTSRALTRMSQPEIARDPNTLERILALGDKIDESLRTKTIADIWLSLGTINPETQQPYFNGQGVIQLSEKEMLSSAVRKTIEQAIYSSKYSELAIILPILMETVRQDVNHRLDEVVECIASQYENTTSSAELKEALSPTLANIGRSTKARGLVKEDVKQLAQEKQRENPDDDTVKSEEKKASMNGMALSESVKSEPFKVNNQDSISINEEVKESEFLEDENKIMQAPAEKVFNDTAIINYLTMELNKLKTLSGGTPDGVPAMLKILNQNEATSTPKLKVLGEFARKKYNSINLGRTADTANFYKSLCCFENLGNTENFTPEFTEFLKTRESKNHRINEDVVNIENYINHYKLILDRLKRIDDKQFGSETLKILLRNAKQQDFSKPLTVLDAIETIKRFIQFDTPTLHQAISRSPRSENFVEQFERWIDFAVDSNEGLSPDDLVWIGGPSNKKELESCYEYIKEKFPTDGHQPETITAPDLNNKFSELTSPGKRTALSKALRQLCANNRDGEVLYDAVCSSQDQTSAGANDGESKVDNQSHPKNFIALLKSYEELNNNSPKNAKERAQTAVDIADFCHEEGGTLEDLKNVLQKFRERTYSPRSLFSAHCLVPKGMHAVITMIESSSPVYSTADILLKLKQVAKKYIESYLPGLGGGQKTLEVYNVIKKFFDNDPKISANTRDPIQTQEKTTQNSTQSITIKNLVEQLNTLSHKANEKQIKLEQKIVQRVAWHT